jgi:hypothetical protein
MISGFASSTLVARARQRRASAAQDRRDRPLDLRSWTKSFSALTRLRTFGLQHPNAKAPQNVAILCFVGRHAPFSMRFYANDDAWPPPRAAAYWSSSRASWTPRAAPHFPVEIFHGRGHEPGLAAIEGWESGKTNLLRLPPRPVDAPPTSAIQLPIVKRVPSRTACAKRKAACARLMHDGGMPLREIYPAHRPAEAHQQAHRQAP